MTMLGSDDQRIRIIVGHYGSGKTEFSVNYAVKLAEQGNKTALVDLDIANPYFRSRERQALLEDRGVHVYSNALGYDITAEIPALSAAIKAPLEDSSFQCVVDVGGNDSGARVLNQFKKYIQKADWDLFCVINGNRPETSTALGALYHIRAIERETNMKITGLINNTHLLKETRVEDIVNGYFLCAELSHELRIPLKYNCCVEELSEQLAERIKSISNFIAFPMNLIMRETWMDR